jgi:hypothetical protein
MLVMMLWSPGCDGTAESVLVVVCQGATAICQGTAVNRLGVIADRQRATVIVRVQPVTVWVSPSINWVPSVIIRVQVLTVWVSLALVRLSSPTIRV